MMSGSVGLKLTIARAYCLCKYKVYAQFAVFDDLELIC